MKIPGTIYSVRFQDCDPFQHLNNSKYFDYFINAREDQFAEVSEIDLKDLAVNKGIGWVIRFQSIVYLKPANLMEKVLIETQVIEVSERSLKVEMRMWDEQRKVLKSVNWTDLVHFNIKKQRSIKHSEEIIEVLRRFYEPVAEMNLDDRVLGVLKKAKPHKKSP